MNGTVAKALSLLGVQSVRHPTRLQLSDPLSTSLPTTQIEWKSQTTHGFFSTGTKQRSPSDKTIKARSSSPFARGRVTPQRDRNMNMIPRVFIRLGCQSVWIQYSWPSTEIKNHQIRFKWQTKRTDHNDNYIGRHLNISNELGLIWSTVKSACLVLLDLFHCVPPRRMVCFEV